MKSLTNYIKDNESSLISLNEKLVIFPSQVDEKLVIFPSQVDEKLVINKNYKIHNYYPKNRNELKAIIIREHYIKKIYDLNDIDVSKITDFNSLFYGDNNTGNEDFDISEWDVSSGENFSWMFNGCYKFNCDLSGWDVSNGKNFSWMFCHCHEFNSDLSKWNISNDANVSDMFYKCYIDNKNKPKGVE